MTAWQLLLAALSIAVPVALFITLAADELVRVVGRHQARRCAWCRRWLSSGRRPATHSCCPRCLPAALEAANRV